MRRIVVIGSGGAGKSTFSRKLGDITGIPVVHLDQLFWHPDWVRTPEDVWLRIVKQEVAKPAWIMDGNFGGTREIRMRAADTIIFLDLSRLLCLWRILKRSVLYYGRTRPDMAAGCYERIDPEFFAWVWNYRDRSRKRALKELAALEGKNIVILQNRREVAEFLHRAAKDNANHTR